MAVEAKPGLQPQAVARPQADRQHIAMFKQRLGERFGLFGRHRNFKAVLAGVARARDEAIDADDAARTGVHEPHGGGVSAQCCQHGFRLRPLQRDQGAIL